MDTKIEIKRFDPKVEIKVLRALNKVLRVEEESISDEEAEKKESVFVMDPSLVMGIIALSQEAKRIIARFISKDETRSIPSFDYESNGNVKVNVGYKYLGDAVNILKATEETISIEAKSDYPLRLSNKHFSILIAPRVGEDI